MEVRRNGESTSGVTAVAMGFESRATSGVADDESIGRSKWCGDTKSSNGE